MDIYRKLLILIIIIITIYILYRLVEKRQILLKMSEGMESLTNGSSRRLIEGLSTAPKQVTDIEKNNTVSLSLHNLTENLGNKSQPLSSFFVKSSFNSAYDGTAISKDMVLYVLSRGYRFLDFEVYNDISNGIIVGFSQTGSFPATSNTNVLFSDIIETVTQNCFKNPCPNAGDPLFIQIRPMYQLFNDNDDDVKKQIKRANNNKLNTMVETALGKISDYNLQYTNKVTPTTPADSLMRKIIVIMDTTSNVMNQKTDGLKNKINISPFSNTDDQQLTIDNFGMLDKTKQIQGLYEILPYDNKKMVPVMNHNSLNIITDYKCNFCPMLAWLPSYISGISSMGVSELGSYEILFNNAGGTAFIQLNEAKSHAYSNNNSTINSGKITVG